MHGHISYSHLLVCPWVAGGGGVYVAGEDGEEAGHVTPAPHRGRVVTHVRGLVKLRPCKYFGSY